MIYNDEDNNLVLGGDVKLNVFVEPMDGQHLADIDFQVRYYTSSTKSRTFQKSELVQVDPDNYVACFNTSEVGAGELKYEITAFYADGDFESGYRKEMKKGTTGFVVEK